MSIDIDPVKNFVPRQNPTKPLAEFSDKISRSLEDVDPENLTKSIGKLGLLATDALEFLLRNPAKYPTQVIAAAKLIYERKLGAIPDTMIQNNMNFVVKWQD